MSTKEERQRESQVIDSLATAIEGMGDSNDGFVQQKKKSKRKARRNKRAAATTGGGGGGGSDEDIGSDEGDDALVRLAAMQKAVSRSGTGPMKPSSGSSGGAAAARKPPPVPAHIAANLQAAASMNAPGAPAEPRSKAGPRRSKAEERLAVAQREHDSLVALFDSTSPADAEDQLQRTLHLTELVAKLDAAKQAVEEEKRRAKEKALPSGEDLLKLTRTNILARQHSDESTNAAAGGADDGGATGTLSGGTKPSFEFPDPRTVRSFAVQDATAAAKARKAAAEAAVEGGFVALGMEDGMLPPDLLEGHRGMFVRPESRASHELILRVARKVASDPTGMLERQLIQHKQYDPKFAFLKPHSPLHTYYGFLRGLQPQHLETLVAAAEREAAAMKPVDVAALAEKLRAMPEDSGEREQELGSIIYPVIEVWYAHDAPKLTGMMLGLETFEELVPLLATPEAFKTAVGSAYESLKKAVEAEGEEKGEGEGGAKEEEEEEEEEEDGAGEEEEDS